MILQVAVPCPLLKCFDYLPPRDGAEALVPGVRLRVPFGAGVRIGVLIGIAEESAVAAAALKRVLRVLDQEPVLAPDLMHLAGWAGRYYHHPPGEVYASALPVLLREGHPAALAPPRRWRITPAGRAALAAGETRRARRQQALLKALQACADGAPDAALREAVPGWAAVVRGLDQKGWVESYTEDPPASSRVLRDGARPCPTAAQAEAVAAVAGGLGTYAAFLLEGVTGSGKTEVYLQVVEAALERDQAALVLVPEIGLTPQLVGRFRDRFAMPIAVFHSRLSNRERLEAWLAAREGRVMVVIGTRSAVFAPLPALGVVIVDEEHDPSLKQQEGFRYHARDLSVVRARALEIPVLLGSATPSLESLYNCDRGRYRHLRLPERVGGAAEAPILPLDLRRREADEGLSAPLLAQMATHIEAGGQVLLYLNRRGFAPILICHECGWRGECGNCDARLTLHLRRGRLVCHHCGVEQPVREACPECGSVDLRPLGQGTERIEGALRRHFPGLGIARVDSDTTRGKGSFESLIHRIHTGQDRILIGTQMLAKGHHFPDVTLVGIVDADQGLFGADYRAGERLAQTILQVAGRAGRAERPGTVLVQTYNPQHPLLLTLSREGYGAYAAGALAERREALLPPFSRQALLRAEAEDPLRPSGFLRAASRAGRDLAEAGVYLLGPVPAPMERRAGRYRAQLLVQAERRGPLHRFLDRWLPVAAGLDEARRVRWSLDVDPVDLS